MQNTEQEIQVLQEGEYEEDSDTPTQADTQYIEGRKTRGLFQKGISGNPGGRPKGKSLKEWTREYLASLTDEQRLEYFQGIPKLDLWRMAEGNPSEDKNISITVPKPILSGITQLDSKDIGHIIDAPGEKDQGIESLGGGV